MLASTVPDASEPTRDQVQETKKRGGKLISDHVRALLINAHQKGISYRHMAVLYGVKEDTAYRIGSGLQYTTKKRGGPRATKITTEAINCLIAAIEDRADITLEEMRSLLEEQQNILVSTSTIARTLEGQLITMKKMELAPERRNSLENKEARRTHALWLQREHEEGARFCYVNESGFGLYTAKTRGKSLKGLPARRVSDNQCTPHVTIMCAICPGLGLMHNVTIVGGARQEHFREFIQALFQHDFSQPMVPRGRESKHYIIFDNAPCHHGVEAALADTVPEHFELVGLPPYSCALNPIEYCFQSVKAHIKRTLSQHSPVLPTEGQTLATARQEFLLGACPDAIREITAPSCLNSFFHVLTMKAPAATRLEDM